MNIEQQRMLASMLQQQAMTPQQGQMVGNHYVPASPLSLLARGLQGYQSNKLMKGADQAEEAQKQQRMQEMQKLIQAVQQKGQLPQFQNQDVQDLALQFAMKQQMGNTNPAEWITFQRTAEAAGLKPGTEEYAKAARTALGLDARAGTVSANERIAGSQDLTNQVAGSQSIIEGSKAGASETAKLNAQLDKKPQIQKEVTLAQERAKTQAALEAAQQQASQTLDSVLPTFDSIDDKAIDGLYGRGESLYPDLARSQKGIDTKASIGRLISNAKLAARGQLKGQGTVSDFEAKMLGDAVTVLENQDISPRMARAAIQDLKDYFKSKAGQSTKKTTAKSEDDQALEWAQQNPNDPRAKQILQMLNR